MKNYMSDDVTGIYNLHDFHNLYERKNLSKKVTSCVSLKIRQCEHP